MECETCGKVFTRKYILNRHILTHTGDKRHKCSHCGRAFTLLQNAKRHERQVHERRGAQREYRCGTCGETFNNMAPFRAHQKTAHSIQSTSRKRPTNKDATGR